MTRGALAILVAVGLYVPLAWGLMQAYRVDPAEVDRLSAQFVRSGCQPEPGERAAYLAGLAVVPAVMLGLTLLGRKPLRREESSAWCFARWGGEAGLAVALLAICWMAFAGDGFFHLRINRCFTHPVHSLPLLAAGLAAVWAAGQKGWSWAAAVVGWVVGGAAVLAVFWMSLRGNDSVH